MKKRTALKKILLSLYHYFCFFLLMAFIITCCMMLFVSTMSKSMNITLTEDNINTAATLTFWNVVFLSLVCTIIDAIRRKITVDRPVKRIVSALDKIAKGDYSVRIPEIKSINRADGLDKIAAGINEMTSELSGVQTLQSDFIANVSHELKTPLSVIQNYTMLLQDPDISVSDREKYASSASEACRRLASLITNILKLNKLENQTIFPTLTNYDLSEQLRLSLLAYENVWENKNIELQTDIDDGVMITSDPELMSLVWSNLLSNSFKFTDNSGKVSVALKESENHVNITVSDTGCGISQEVGKHIFEKFYQADTSHKTQGNGLGLALVKRVIDIVNGDIGVSSEVGKGSTFTVRLRKNG